MSDLRAQVATDLGIPEHAHRLTGETEAELRADALAFCRSFKVGNPPQDAVDPSQGRGRVDTGPSPADLLASAIRESLDRSSYWTYR
jgi:hypothetical protein